MPTFDGESLVITLDSAVTDVNVLDFYKSWKQWQLAGNMRFPPALRSDGGNPLSSIINQGAYIFLNNVAGWRIKPPEENITIYFTGNLAVEDTALPAFIPTTGAFTAAILGLQPVTQGVTPVMAEQLEYAGFEGGVSIDATDGVSGTGNINGIPIGTPSLPVNNTTDALTIANNRGLRKLYVKGALTLSGTSFNGYEIFGNGAFITISGISFARFHDCYVTGSCGMRCWFTDCAIGNMTCSGSGATIHFMHAAFAGTITLNVVNLIIVDCVSGVSGETGAIFDFNSTASSMEVRGYTGGIQLINKNGAQSTTIDMTSGNVVLDSTVTNGTIVVRGQANIEDNSTGTSLIKKHGLMNPVNINATTNKMIEGLRSHHSGTGTVFYWNPVEGNDTLDGLTPDTARATFSSIHDNLVVSDRHDIVFAMPSEIGGELSSTENISITKDYVFLRGPGRDFLLQPANDALDAINITGNGVEVSKIRIANSPTSTKHAVSASGDFVSLQNLIIQNVNNGVQLSGAIRCSLKGLDIQNNLGYGLKITGGSTNVKVEESHFGSNVGSGILIDNAGGDDVSIENGNTIHENAGYGIDITAASTGVVLHHDMHVFGNTPGDIRDLAADTYREEFVNLDAQASAIWAKAIEGLTAEEMLRVMLASLAGKRAGIGTATETYYNVAGTTPRVTFAPTDANGNGTPTLNGAP